MIKLRKLQLLVNSNIVIFSEKKKFERFSIETLHKNMFKSFSFRIYEKYLSNDLQGKGGYKTLHFQALLSIPEVGGYKTSLFNFLPPN